MCCVLITSSSFITCTGLKKWRPTNLSGLPDAIAIFVTGRELVLEANIAPGFIKGPRFCQGCWGGGVWRDWGDRGNGVSGVLGV